MAGGAQSCALLKEQKTDEHKARVRDIFLYIGSSCVTAFSPNRQSIETRKIGTVRLLTRAVLYWRPNVCCFDLDGDSTKPVANRLEFGPGLQSFEIGIRGHRPDVAI